MTPRRAVAVAGLTIASLLFAACGSGNETGRGSGKGTGARNGGSPASTTASTTASASSAATPTTGAPADLTAILQRAVTEERHAEATYRNVIAGLGNTGPFTNIADSEAQHVAALEELTTFYHVEIGDIAPAGETSPTTKQAACQLGVDAETADIALYDDLLPQVTSHPDVTQVFQNLRAASQDNHLPAFERCN